MHPHPLADLFPRLTGPELTALAADIATNGLLQPIVLFNGKILDGRNRLAACELAGVEPRFETFEGTEDEALAFVLSTNLHRRHLTTAQRAALAVKLLPLEKKAARRRQGSRNDIHPGSDGGEAGQAFDLAGKRVGVGRDSVWRASKIAADSPDVLRAIEEGTVRTLGEAQKLAALDEERRCRVLDRMRREGLRFKDAEQEATPWYYRSTGEVEWYTPPDVLDAARRVLGGPFDLDPASCEAANRIVQAERYYTIEDDGLQQHWTAERVWLNPPYGFEGPRGGNSRQGAWVRRLLTEFETGRTKQAMLLVRSAPCQAWFQPLWRFPLVFLRKRLQFVAGPGVTGQPVAFSVIVGVGVDAGRFVDVFRSWGQVVVPGPDSVSVSIRARD